MTTSSPSNSPTEGVPGETHLGPWIARFDTEVDTALDRVRGQRVFDLAFRNASHLGDFSMIWHLVAVMMALVGGRRGRRRAVLLSLLLGAESLFVNQGVKRLFRRQRPTVNGHSGLTVRQPRTSSFPSGHASSAVFASSLLCRWYRGPWCLLWRGLALVVAISRSYVRIHHASDVLGGALCGALLARLVRPVIRRR